MLRYQPCLSKEICNVVVDVVVVVVLFFLRTRGYGVGVGVLFVWCVWCALASSPCFVNFVFF